MQQYPKGTQKIYSTWIPRGNRYFPKANKVVAFGIQGFIKKYLIEYFNEHFFNRPLAEVVAEYKRYI
jgi:nicotinamide phosphoribosyltransferase